MSRKRDSAIYTVHLTFKNVKSIPVKFEYKEMINIENAQFTVFPKESNDQQAQIESTVDGIQMRRKDDKADDYAILAANGCEQMYEYEIHFNYGKRGNYSRKQQRRQ